MNVSRDLSYVVRDIYVTAQSSTPWAPVLQRVTDLTGLSGAAFLFHDLRESNSRVQYTVGVNPEAVRNYEQYYGSIDEWRPSFLKRTQGELILAEELCSPDVLKRTEFYKDFLRKFDLRLYCATATRRESSALEFLTFYAQSWKKEPPRKAIVQIGMILPHLAAALQLRERFLALDSKTSILCALLDSHREGVILLDSMGNVIHANRLAEEIFALEDGMRISSRRVRFSDTSDQSLFEQAVAKAAKLSNGKLEAAVSAMRIRRKRHPPLYVVVRPLISESPINAGVGGVVVFIGIPTQKKACRLETLMSLFQLTLAEAEISELLSLGHSLQEAAAARGVSRETARSQIKAAMNKVGVRRQSELVRVCLSIPGM